MSPSQEMLQHFADRVVAERRAPGIVCVRGRADRADLAIGVAGSMTADPADAAERPMRVDAIFRIQSMTKPIVAVETLRLVEAGRLSLDDPVTRWLPELTDRQVLRDPAGPLDATVRAEREITVRDLLTNQSGYGISMDDSPLAQAMRANKTEAGPDPVTLGADEWLARLAGLPLAFQPGSRFRYHHSFGILGILLSRLVGRPLGEHLASDLFPRLGMVDTGYVVPPVDAARLPAAVRRTEGTLVETEPAGGGFYVGPEPFDLSHAEIVSTASDVAAFARMVANGGRLSDGTALISAESLAAATRDQIAAAAKHEGDFFPDFWEHSGWGYGFGVEVSGPRAGRVGWTGGQGTDFWVDPDGEFGILLTQVELGPGTFDIIEDFIHLG